MSGLAHKKEERKVPISSIEAIDSIWVTTLPNQRRFVHLLVDVFRWKHQERDRNQTTEEGSRDLSWNNFFAPIVSEVFLFVGDLLFVGALETRNYFSSLSLHLREPRSGGDEEMPRKTENELWRMIVSSSKRLLLLEMLQEKITKTINGLKKCFQFFVQTREGERRSKFLRWSEAKKFEFFSVASTLSRLKDFFHREVWWKRWCLRLWWCLQTFRLFSSRFNSFSLCC